MGQAKQRGTREERVARAVERNRTKAEQAKTREDERMRALFLQRKAEREAQLSAPKPAVVVAAGETMWDHQRRHRLLMASAALALAMPQVPVERIPVKRRISAERCPRHGAVVLPCVLCERGQP